MVDTEDSNYTCTLSAASVEKAKSELYEDPKDRLGAVQTLRKWIKEQQHFTCRTDTIFLLMVLRTAKFSQLRSREIIEKILTYRSKFPQYLCNIDSQDPSLIAYLERGHIVPLPKTDKEGRTIWLMRVGETADVEDIKQSQKLEVRASMTINALLKETNEDAVVNGEMLVFDMTGYTAKHLAKVTFDSDRTVHKIYQDCMLGRMKGLHFYNGGSFFEAAMNFIRPFLKKKTLERIHVHSTMESLYKVVPMEFWPDEYLPDDYKGPSAGPLQSLIDDLKRRLMDPEFRSRLLEYSSDRYKMNEQLAKTVKVPNESFRKLNID